MAQTPNTNSTYPLPKNSYIAFDALALRQLIVDRLNQQGTFTDQNYIGSNLASIIDIVSYAYNTLIYYLNKTATESMFTEAQLYENINKIVKVLDYKPLGYQTSTLPFFLNVSNLPTNITFTLPRYSYVTSNSVTYSLNEDITFVYTGNGQQDIPDVSYTKFLVQGRFVEYPLYEALGDANEMLTLIPNTTIDHYNIHVYCKPVDTNVWTEYTRAQSLYLERSDSLAYEIRFNSNQQYEIKFGDGISGRKLEKGDAVSVYYVVSDGARGIVGPYTFNNASMARFSTSTFQSILTDTLPGKNLLSDSQARQCAVTNIDSSTQVQDIESPEHIREAAPAAFRSQYRLVTEKDYVNFIMTNYSNLLASVQIFNNTTYMSTYMKYYYNLGITSPAVNDRALFNQILFSSSCNFNNIYVVVVPKSFDNQPGYLLPSQKQFIKTGIDSVKVAVTQTTFVDPVYVAFAIGVTDVLYEVFSPFTESLARLQIIRDANSRRSNTSIIADAQQALLDYFDQANCSLGQVVQIRDVEQRILAIDGVGGLRTIRIDNFDIYYEGLCMFAWNPTYIDQEKEVITSSKILQAFQFPYLFDVSGLSTKIFI